MDSEWTGLQKHGCGLGTISTAISLPFFFIFAGSFAALGRGGKASAFKYLILDFIFGACYPRNVGLIVALTAVPSLAAAFMGSCQPWSKGVRPSGTGWVPHSFTHLLRLMWSKV